MPILMAAMGEQACACAPRRGRADDLQHVPAAYTRRAAGIMCDAAARAGRPAPREVVQYVPCCVRDDGDEARRLAKNTVAAMPPRMVARHRLAGHARGDRRLQRAAVRSRSGDGAARPRRAVERRPRRSLLAEYAIAGTLDECLKRFRVTRTPA